MFNERLRGRGLGFAIVLLALASPGDVRAQAAAPPQTPARADAQAVTPPPGRGEPAAQASGQAPSSPGQATGPAPATRAEALRQTREEKERAVEPYAPNVLEKTLHVLEDGGIPLLGRDGLYVRLGSLTTGSGFAYGGGYRTQRPFRRHGTLDLWTAGSLQGYWAMEGRATFPQLADGRLHLEGYASRRDYPKEDFFGLGPDSKRVDQSDYLLLTNLFGGRAGVRPASTLFAGGGLEYLQPHVGRGKDESLPSIADRFDETTAPGLSEQPSFIRTFGFFEVDYRQPKNARKGGWYRVNFSHYDDREQDRYSFNKVDVDLQQFFSLFAERRVFVGRAFASTSDVKDGQQVPFYLMPTLGGQDTLRGFRQYRFRGPHALLLQAEYRWEIWSGFEGALFYDTGKVTERRADLNLRDLERDYGIGFRFNTDNGVVVRVDAGFGSRDGKHLYIVFGGVF